MTKGTNRPSQATILGMHRRNNASSTLVIAQQWRGTCTGVHMSFRPNYQIIRPSFDSLQRHKNAVTHAKLQSHSSSSTSRSASTTSTILDNEFHRVVRPVGWRQREDGGAPAGRRNSTQRTALQALRTAVLDGGQQTVRRRFNAALSRLSPQAPASDRHLPGGHASAARKIRRAAVPVGARI